MLDRPVPEREKSSVANFRGRWSLLAIASFVFFTCCSEARGQSSSDNVPVSDREYRRGYEEGYEAGLRAAKAAAAASKSSSNAHDTKVVERAGPDHSEQVTTPLPAQQTSDSTPPNSENQETTLFNHSQTSPFWISGQANVIAQWHPRFYAKYSGPNSFEHASEQAVSRVLTMYLGYQLDETTETMVHVEETGWSGLSQALGLGGFTNEDVVRNPQLTAEPYIARLWIRKIIPLSDEILEVPRTPMSMFTTLPVRRLDIRVGKFGLVDFLDVNAVANDSHMQFMNWTVVNNGAYDYAADTRGYTYGGIVDFEDKSWGLRFAEALEPKTANGTELEFNLQRAHSENLELEFRPELLTGKSTIIRFLGFMNYANMGDYHDAIAQFLAGKTPTPQIDAHPKRVTMKYGFGINGEQEFTEDLRGFFRVGWNEGQHETWAFTEVDQHVSLGGDLRGTLWNRPNDKLGLAFVANGISANHRRYLALGGLGFVLGDGNLSYGPEEIIESYYNFPIPLERGLYGAFDLQFINNPGYNRDRGPVIVPGLRLHLEL